jgi:hypothetical protein
MTLRYVDIKIAEADLHRTVAGFLDAALLPPAIWTTFPAGWGKLTKATSGRLKGAGLKAGMPDILVFYRARTLGIELKTEQGTLSKEQEEMFPLLNKAGVVIEVCRSVEEVLEALTGNNIPIRDVEIAA